jgi:hypothetical protein
MYLRDYFRDVFFLWVLLNEHYLERQMFLVFLQLVAARVNLKDEKYSCTKMYGPGGISRDSNDGMSHSFFRNLVLNLEQYESR